MNLKSDGLTAAACSSGVCVREALVASERVHRLRFKSFAEGERFDCNAACCGLEQGPAAAFKLVNCQDLELERGASE